MNEPVMPMNAGTGATLLSPSSALQSTFLEQLLITAGTLHRHCPREDIYVPALWTCQILLQRSGRHSITFLADIPLHYGATLAFPISLTYFRRRYSLYPPATL